MRVVVDDKGAGLDYSLIAFNVRCLRMARNFTQSELAAWAGVDKSTIHRVETAQKVHRHSLQKVAVALSETVGFLNTVLPYGLPNEKREHFIKRRSEFVWFPSEDRRKWVPTDDQARIQQREERLRLGRLGMVKSFQAYMVVMPNSPALAEVEVFERASFGPNPSYKHVVLVCIRGEAVVRFGEQEILLSQGDSIGYSASEVVTVEPARPIGPTDEPPVVWAVTANRRGQLPIEFEKRKRVRTRHAPAKLSPAVPRE